MLNATRRTRAATKNSASHSAVERVLLALGSEAGAMGHRRLQRSRNWRAEGPCYINRSNRRKAPRRPLARGPTPFRLDALGAGDAAAGAGRTPHPPGALQRDRHDPAAARRLEIGRAHV